jgi:hypothetical protein
LQHLGGAGRTSCRQTRARRSGGGGGGSNRGCDTWRVGGDSQRRQPIRHLLLLTPFQRHRIARLMRLIISHRCFPNMPSATAPAPMLLLLLLGCGLRLLQVVQQLLCQLRGGASEECTAGARTLTGSMFINSSHVRGVLHNHARA